MFSFRHIKSWDRMTILNISLNMHNIVDIIWSELPKSA